MVNRNFGGKYWTRHRISWRVYGGSIVWREYSVISGGHRVWLNSVNVYRQLVCAGAVLAFHALNDYHARRYAFYCALSDRDAAPASKSISINSSQDAPAWQRLGRAGRRNVAVC